uniref:Transmembrane and TPR repeat-containing protein 1 n=1 Tax=Noccaea caerulescens TaxID=107243 RepID=A0A1J3D3B4_NOCCA
MLKSEPSLSVYCDSGDVFKTEDQVSGIDENLERRVSIGDSVEADFSFGGGGAREEQGLEIERPPSPPMHLAAGLGIDKFDLYGKEIKFDLPGFDDENCDDYYKSMLEEYPSHPLLLKNYAKFLEYKGDLSGAQEYYHKCTVVEPSDGLALANYGRLVMKLHHDEAKASSYFERAVQASPQDSNVLAAYASFLWEINDDEVDDYTGDRNRKGKEEFEPEPAEKRSSRLSETDDGETLCRYAKAFWSINGDHEKALFYFEKAVKASPNDSIILGEYARFLWEIEE